MTAWRDAAHAAAAMPAAARDTLAAWCKHWLAAREGSVTPRTLAFYRQHLAHAIRALGERRLADVAAQDVRDLLAGLTLSPRSRAHVRTVLRMCLQLAVDDGVLARNPVDTVAAPRVERYEAHALTPTERAAFLAAADLHRLRALWHLYTDYGLRLEEGLRLLWGDWDRERQTLRIRRAKGDKERTLPLTAAHAERLAAHWEAQLIDRSDNPRWREHGLMFASEVGTKLGPPNVRRAFKALLEDAGLPRRIRIHDLRHTATTNLVLAGIDLTTVGYITGHADPSVLLGIYAHAQTERTREAAEIAAVWLAKTGA